MARTRRDAPAGAAAAPRSLVRAVEDGRRELLRRSWTSRRQAWSSPSRLRRRRAPPRTSGGRRRRCTSSRGRVIAAPSARPRSPNAAARNACAVLDGLERPEAVDDPDLEPAAEERAVATAPRRVLRPIAAQPGDVVAAVVVDARAAARRGAGCGPPRRVSLGTRRGTRSSSRRRRRPTRRRTPGALAIAPSDHRDASRRARASCLARIPSASGPRRRRGPRRVRATGPSASSARGILRLDVEGALKPPARAALQLDRGRPPSRRRV